MRSKINCMFDYPIYIYILFLENFIGNLLRAIVSLDRLNCDVIMLLDRMSAMIPVSMITNHLSSLISITTMAESDDDYDTIEQRLLLLKKFLMVVDTKWKYYFETVHYVMKIFLKKDGNPKVKHLCVNVLSDIFTMINKPGEIDCSHEHVRNLTTSWKDFVFDVLKNHYTDALYMKMLSIATRKLYACAEFHENSGLALADLYDMVVGHSNFLSVFIDEEKAMKDAKGNILLLLYIKFRNLDLFFPHLIFGRHYGGSTCREFIFSAKSKI